MINLHALVDIYLITGILISAFFFFINGPVDESIQKRPYREAFSYAMIVPMWLPLVVMLLFVNRGGDDY